MQFITIMYDDGVSLEVYPLEELKRASLIEDEDDSNWDRLVLKFKDNKTYEFPGNRERLLKFQRTLMCPSYSVIVSELGEISAHKLDIDSEL